MIWCPFWKKMGTDDQTGAAVNTDEIVAGPELNHRIALEVMGWHLDEHYEHWLKSNGDYAAYNGSFSPYDDPWNPSQDMNDAWRVVKNLHDQRVWFDSDWEFDSKPYAAFFQERDSYGPVGWIGALADTMQLAICKAALAFVAERERKIALGAG
jgi:hypothetical protein